MKKYSGFTGGVIKNTTNWRSRFIIGTATTGTVRMEWVQARYSQLIPTNWSSAEIMQWIPSYCPLQYMVSDAQNIIVKKAIEQDAEWLFLLEEDNVLPPNTFWRLNDYMSKRKIPVISGLYFTKSNPPEPMIYRGYGDSYYSDWRIGDKVWASGIPTGTFLCHMSIIRAMWNESPEYKAGDVLTRRVFAEPHKTWFNPERGRMETQTGTSDLGWCDRVIKEKFLEKAGWPDIQKKKYPFLVDTNIFVQHINQSGTMYPLVLPKEFEPLPKEVKKNARHIEANKSWNL